MCRKAQCVPGINRPAVSGAKGDLTLRSIWSDDNLEVLKEHPSLLVKHFVLAKVIHVCNKNKPWFHDDCRRGSASSRRLIFGGPVIAFDLIGMSLSITRGGLM